jgi:hypothetical protein
MNCERAVMAEEIPTMAIIDTFLELVTSGETPSLERLTHALDELALSIHGAPAGAPSQIDDDPPARRYQTVRAELGARFPDLGHYPVADPLGNVDDVPDVSSATDDLADIVGDLKDARWRYENLGPDDAYWHLHLLYEVHWGRHLRQLSLYLHVKRFC